MPLKVYYLDDELDLCELFKEMYSTNDIEVKCFSSPEEMVKAVKERPPHIIFLDFRLPGTTGIEVANELPLEIPKILVTGESHIKTDYKFLKILEKPTPKKEVEELLKNRMKSL